MLAYESWSSGLFSLKVTVMSDDEMLAVLMGLMIDLGLCN